MRVIYLVLAACVVFFLGACASTVSGAKYLNDKARIEEMLSKKSPKKDIYYGLGQPLFVNVSGGGSSWTYYKFSDRMSAGSLIPILNAFTMGRSYDVQVSVIEFDGFGKAISIKSSDFQVTTVNANFFDYEMDNAYIEKHVYVLRDEMKENNLPFDEAIAREMLELERVLRHQMGKNKR